MAVTIHGDVGGEVVGGGHAGSSAGGSGGAYLLEGRGGRIRDLTMGGMDSS
jgi:hypothetical protein